MASVNYTETINHIQNTIKHLKPEDFLSHNPDVSSKAVELLKTLYDFTKSPSNPAAENNCRFLNLNQSNPLTSKKKKQKKLAISRTECPLVKLIIEDFDESQIWEQIQLQNAVMHDSLVFSVSRILAHQRQLDIIKEEDEENSVENNGTSGKFSEAATVSKKKANKQKIYPKSIVDDNFFNLAQMTEFLENVESKMAIQKNYDLNQNEGSDSDTDEDSIDLFEDVEDDSGVDSDEDASGNVYYNEFFDQPLSQQKEKMDDSEDPTNAKKLVHFNLSENHDDKDGDLDSVEEDELGEEEEADDEVGALEDIGVKKEDRVSKNSGSKPPEDLSNFEKMQRRVEENIDVIEEEALKPKPWHLQGEATSLSRPENSLLEEHLIYDHLIRQAPEITNETTLRLEDIIKQRIKDQAWDDVQRKIKPIEDASEYKKRLVLDAEKSKMSLTQIYEQEYIKQKQKEGGEEEKEAEPIEHLQIQKDMDKLFAQLDALSNYHFTPAKPSAEVKIISNVSSITIEEVAPVSVSDAALIAPQEIQAQEKGAIKGKSELSSTDRNRERRIKKKKQKLKRIAQEEKAKLKGLGLRNIKLADNIVKANDKSKSKTAQDDEKVNHKHLKSSKAFFAKLQEQVQTHIKGQVGKRKKPTKQLSAKKFKM